MGGLPCYKAAMDGRARTDSDVSKSLVNLKQVLDCLKNTATVSPETTFDIEMQNLFLEAGKRFQVAVYTAAEAYATVATGLEREARKRWPDGEGVDYEHKD